MPQAQTDEEEYSYYDEEEDKEDETQKATIHLSFQLKVA